MTAFDDETAKFAKADNYFIVIDGLSTRYSVFAVQNPAHTYKRLLSIPSSIAQRVYPLEGRSSLGSVSFELEDENGEITDIVSTDAPGAPIPSLINRRAQMFAGFRNIDAAEYILVFTGEFYEPPVYSRDERSWKFTLADLKRPTINEKIMKNASSATPTIISGNFVNIYFALLTGDFANVTFPVTTSGATPTGLGIAATDINQAGLVAEREDWAWYINMRFEFRRPEKAKTFFEKELFIIFGYPIVETDGRLNFRMYHAPHPADPIKTLGKAKIVNLKDVVQRWDLHLNKIEIQGDFDPDTGNFDTVLASFEDTQDQIDTKEVSERTFQLKGLHSDLNGATIARIWLERILQRVRRPPLAIPIETDFTIRDLQAGDVAEFSHDEVPDTALGTVGVVSKRVEITAVATNFKRGTNKVDLLDTAIGNRYRVIAPNTLPDYTSQTADERAKYGSIALAATDEFSNGDPTHETM